MILVIVAIYLVLVLSVGALSHRLFRGTGEDYFLATRSIGPFVLLMSLFGTHMTSFTLLGASGEAYHHGIGVFALMASASALMVPLVFYLLAPRLWVLGKQHGFVTQVQYFRARWDCDLLGLVLFAVLVTLVVPYLLIGVMAGGITLHEISERRVPEWVGSLLVSAVVLLYVTYGGLRGTAWVNTFQTLVFMTMGVLAFAVITREIGGLSGAMAQLAASHPTLLAREGHFQPLHVLTFMFIPLSAGMFPHLFMHWLSARSAASFRAPLVWYPLCMATIWVPSVLLGVMGNLEFPDLQGPQANAVLVKMIAHYAPEILGGLLAAGVFAAVMSSLDSQVLALGTMFTQDIVRHYGFHDRMNERQQILVGRLFVTAILVTTFVLALVADRSIFALGIWSFTGFAALIPIVLAALFWRRSTKAGVLASVATTIVLWLYFFSQAGRSGYTVGDTGIMPVTVLLGASAIALVMVSLATRPPARSVLARFFREVAPP